MAPEIHMRKPYIGSSVDLFACGIILFIMYTQHPPFTKAEPNDPFYRLLCANRADLFWKAHSKNKPEGFFSEEFKNLITFDRKYGDTVTYEDMHGIKKRKKKRARKTVDGLPDSVTVD